MLRKRLTTFGIIAVIGLTCSSAWGFDGQRKGFVVGGGLGVAPSASYSIEIGPFAENKAGAGLNLIIGYAWDEANMIVYEGSIAGYETDKLSIETTFLTARGDQRVTQGFNGLAWYHYFGSTGKTFFSVIGLGAYAFDIEDVESNKIGRAFLAGAGYEFTRHFGIILQFSAGETTLNGVGFTHSHLNVLITVVAF